MMDQELSHKSVGAVANAVAILRFLAQAGRPKGVTIIARETGVSASTCFNILRTLASVRLIEFEAMDKTYRMGLGVLALSVPLLGVNQVDLVRPELQRLAEAHKSLICLWLVTDGERMVLVDKVWTGGTVRVDMALGSRLPSYVGAMGRCYAAMKGLRAEDLRAHFDSLRWQSPPDFSSYLKDVEAARADGYAFDYGNLFVGLEIAASVITDASGVPRLAISAISIAGQLTRRDILRQAEDIRASSDWVSEVLFGVSRGERQRDRNAASKAQAGAAPSR